MRCVCHAHVWPSRFACDVWWPPNIEGEASLETTFGLLHNSAIISGVFAKGRHFTNAISGNSGGSSYSITLDASLGNSSYSGSKVQVNALQTLVCIKT